MSEDIKTRLKSTSEQCQTCYEAWSVNNKDAKLREALQDSIHELRKVASRLEIELAISERDDLKQKPLPIPPHRDARARTRNAQDDDESNGNGNSGGGNRDARSSERQGVKPNIAKGLKPSQHSRKDSAPDDAGDDSAENLGNCNAG
jgi:hypothetical protein